MEQQVAALFLTFFALEFLVEFVLNELNLRHVRAHRADEAIPEFFRGRLNPDEYEKSVEYTIAKGRFQRWSAVYGGLLTLVLLFGGLLGFLDEGGRQLAEQLGLDTYGQGVFFCLGVGLYFSFAGLATDIYSTFGLEAKFASTR